MFFYNYHYSINSLLHLIGDTPEFTYLWPTMENSLHLDPIEAREARQLNACYFKAKWRSNRPVYKRPTQNLTTYREPQVTIFLAVIRV